MVDLFSGCGGLTLGVAEAARSLGVGLDVRLAVDVDPEPLKVFEANFPEAWTETNSVEAVFDGELGSGLSGNERAVVKKVGAVDALLAGPPCQGHSDLNNHTRRSDPRNLLYLRVARAAQVLKPRIVIIENVPAVRHDVAQAATITTQALRSDGYAVAEAVVSLSFLGVPQSRRRHVVLAMSEAREPEALLEAIPARCTRHPERGVLWAIGDLARVRNGTTFDTPSEPSKQNKRRINWLFDNRMYDLPNRLRPPCHRSEHSYRSMYGRLRPNSPAQTLTTGFGSMGQGRYVHPTQRRTITPHEAARLQLFPDFFSFEAATTRGALARMIGNAVPHALSRDICMMALADSFGLLEATAVAGGSD